MSHFDTRILSNEDLDVAEKLVGSWVGSEARLRRPDLIIAPDGVPYLYRWFLLPREPARGEVYFHIQVKSDPERPLHDHPWDNQSVILAGGYNEVIQRSPPFGLTTFEPRFKGDVIQRKAKEAHRLILPEDVPYTMSLFTTGPEVQDWGFWEVGEHSGLPANKVLAKDVTAVVDGKSVWRDKR